MKNYAKMLVAIAFTLGLCGASKAESQDGVIATLPFKFVVAGKTLPAGTYIVRNTSNDPAGPLMITNHDGGKSVLVLPYMDESASTNNPELDFQRGGEAHFLSAIRTTQRIAVSQSAITEAEAASRSNAPVSGGSE